MMAHEFPFGKSQELCKGLSTQTKEKPCESVLLLSFAFELAFFQLLALGIPLGRSGS